MRKTLRIAYVRIVESFEVRILVVATYCTQIYHAKTPESLNAKTTAEERYFHTCLTCVDTPQFCNTSERGEMAGGDEVQFTLPMKDTVKQWSSNHLAQRWCDRQCGKLWKHTAQARWIKQLRVQSAASCIPLWSIYVRKVLDEGATLGRQYSNSFGVKRDVARMV